MRLIVGGGRAVESSDAKGSVVVGVRTLSEGGRVGNFSREQVIISLVLMLFHGFLRKGSFEAVVACMVASHEVEKSASSYLHMMVSAKKYGCPCMLCVFH